MARYLIKNARIRRPVTVLGYTLASSFSSKKGEAGSIWLSEKQFNSPNVQWLLETGRLELVKQTGVPPKPIIEEPPPVEEAPPVIEEPTAEPLVEEEKPEEESSPEHSSDSLSGLRVADLKKIASSLEVATKGLRKAQIIEAILEAQ